MLTGHEIVRLDRSQSGGLLFGVLGFKIGKVDIPFLTDSTITSHALYDFLGFRR